MPSNEMDQAEPTNTPYRWTSLPPEIRNYILSFLTIDKKRAYWPPHHRRSRRMEQEGSEEGDQARYAVVNREWQSYIEAHTFSQLTLHQDDLDMFECAVHNAARRSALRRVWLRIELPKDTTTDQHVFSEAVWTLFKHMFYIPRPAEAGRPGVTLELSVHSRADTLRFSPPVHKILNDSVWCAAHDNARRVMRSPKPSPPHAGEVKLDAEHQGASVPARVATDDGPPSIADYAIDYDTEDEDAPDIVPRNVIAEYRTLGSAAGLGLHYDRRGLPAAAVVTELVVRLQSLRHLSFPRALRPILDALPRLQRLHYECRQAARASAGTASPGCARASTAPCSTTSATAPRTAS